MTLKKNIFSFDRKFKKAIQVFSDCIFINLSFLISLYLRLNHIEFIYNTQTFIVLSVITTSSIIIFILLGFYKTVIRFFFEKSFINIILGVVLSSFLVFFISKISNYFLPRSIPFIYSLFLLFFISGSRFFIKYLYDLSLKIEKVNVVIFGNNLKSLDILNTLKRSVEYKILYFVTNDKSILNAEISGVKIIDLTKFKEIIDQQKFDLFLLADLNISNEVKNIIFNYLDKFPLKVKFITNFKDLIDRKQTLSKLTDVSIESLIGRDKINAIPNLLKKQIENKTVLVTGAGGSIGSELCNQIYKLKPKILITLDLSEYSIYSLEKKLKILKTEINSNCKIISKIFSVQDLESLKFLFQEFKIDTVYHAAAYKHVPLLEKNVLQTIKNNIFGTVNLVKTCLEFEVPSFTLISTDKAVRPTNFMGASKRFSELYCQAYSNSNNKTKISIVRFGNVFDSSGSVIPLFREQIEKGGPITLTHKKMQRYFMTISEAVELVIQSSSMAKGGEIFVLDMGKPINILDIAQKMSRLNGLHPTFKKASSSTLESQIQIKITGLREGEKLHEELFLNDNLINTQHPKIKMGDENSLSIENLFLILTEIEKSISENNISKLKIILRRDPIFFNSK